MYHIAVPVVLNKQTTVFYGKFEIKFFSFIVVVTDTQYFRSFCWVYKHRQTTYINKLSLS